MCISVLKNSFTHNDTPLSCLHQPKQYVVESKSLARQKVLILLLLLLSGNVQPNPGPPANHIDTPEEFKSRSGLGIIHINVRSLLPKVDLIKLWITSTDADILVLSETWLNESVLDKDIYMSGYKVFSCDRPRKGGGIAIYVKNRFHITPLSSLSVPK